MKRQAFQQRVEQAGLSLWELGNLLGIHPYHLHTGDVPGLTALPARVIIDLARRLDLHPADLIEELGPPTPIRSTTAADTMADSALPDLDTDTDTDTLTVLTALATSIPLTADELATALRWTLDRVTKALNHAHAHPALAGPVALRRIPPGWLDHLRPSGRAHRRPAPRPGRQHPLPRPTHRRSQHLAGLLRPPRPRCI